MAFINVKVDDYWHTEFHTRAKDHGLSMNFLVRKFIEEYGKGMFSICNGQLILNNTTTPTQGFTGNTGTPSVPPATRGRPPKTQVEKMTPLQESFLNKELPPGATIRQVGALAQWDRLPKDMQEAIRTMGDLNWYDQVFKTGTWNSELVTVRRPE